MANLKMMTNVPEIVTFKFDTWKEWQNQGANGPYKTYSIGVENRGENKYFSVYEKEYLNLFSKLENLKDRTLEILKYEDGKYKNWKIMENGVDITPEWNSPSPKYQTAEKNAPGSNLELPGAFQKHYKALVAEITQLKKDMTTLKRLHPEFDNSQVLDEVAEEKVARMINDEVPAEYPDIEIEEGKTYGLDEIL